MLVGRMKKGEMCVRGRGRCVKRCVLERERGMGEVNNLCVVS